MASFLKYLLFLHAHMYAYICIFIFLYIYTCSVCVLLLVCMISGLTMWKWTTSWHALSWGRPLLLYSWVQGKWTKILHKFVLDIYNFSRLEEDLWLPNPVDCLFMHSFVSEAGFHAIAWSSLECSIQPRMLHTMTVLWCQAPKYF